jgi:PDZ domain-containing protein
LILKERAGLSNPEIEVVVEPEGPAQRARKFLVALSLLLFSTAIVVALALPTPYLIDRPGPAFNTLAQYKGVEIISVSGAATYPTSGALNMLTVQEYGSRDQTPSWLEILQAWIDPSQSVIPLDVVYPPRTSPQKVQAQNQQLMLDSQAAATEVVLRNLKLGQEVKVTYGLQSVSGPSAGMMFALGLYDKLTPGELTAGHLISGTGTIDSAGNVGPIGGIQMKLYSAKAAKSDWFLAPIANCPEVVSHIPSGIKVVAVSNFLDALNAVNIIAANADTQSLATCK